MHPISEDIIGLLDYKAAEYETEGFIENDPISIPKMFSSKADIEIAGFFAAILAWGRRTTIINSAHKLMRLMDDAPYHFITQHLEHDLKPLITFVHRTYNAMDLLYTIAFLRHHYTYHDSLSTAFFPSAHQDVKDALIHFHDYFFSLPDVSLRTRKHIGTPIKQSACKRLNMYLRWMIRQGSAVDFGIWDHISAAHLMIPLDVHSGNVARRLQLLRRPQNDWRAVEELTALLRTLRPDDPARYDYALFGLGAEERYR